MQLLNFQNLLKIYFYILTQKKLIIEILYKSATPMKLNKEILPGNKKKKRQLLH